MLSAKLIAYLTLVVAVATVAHDVSATALDPKEPSLADALPVSRTHVSSQGRTLRTRDSDTEEDADKVEDPDAAEDVDTVEDADTIEDSNTVDDSSERLLFRTQGKFLGQVSIPKVNRKRPLDSPKESQKRLRTETSFLPSNGGGEKVNLALLLDMDFTKLLVNDVEAAIKRLEANQLDLPDGLDSEDAKRMFTSLLSELDPKRHIGVSDAKSALAHGNSDLRKNTLQLSSDKVKTSDKPPSLTLDEYLAKLKSLLENPEAITGGSPMYPLASEWLKVAPTGLVKKVDMNSKFDSVEKMSRYLQAEGFGERLELTDDKVTYLVKAFRVGQSFEEIRHEVDGPMYRAFWDSLLQWDQTAVYRSLMASFFHKGTIIMAATKAMISQARSMYYRPEILKYIHEYHAVFHYHSKRMQFLENLLEDADRPVNDVINRIKMSLPANKLDKEMLDVYASWYGNAHQQRYSKDKVTVLD